MTSHLTYSQRYQTVRADVLDALPDAAREKWTSIKTGAIGAQALEQAAQEEVRSHEQHRSDLQFEFKRLVEAAEDGNAEASGAAAQKEREIRLIEAEIERAKARLQINRERLDAHRGVVKSLEAWLSQQKNRKFALAKGEVRLRKGETPASALKRVRREIGRLNSELEAVRLAPVPASERKAHVREFIQRKAIAPSVTGRCGGDVAIDLMPPIGLDLKGPISTAGVEGLITWLFGDLIVEKLEQQIDAETDHAAALSSEDRERAIRDIERKIVAVERDEEALIAEGIGMGLELLRRPEASPEAILGICEA